MNKINNIEYKLKQKKSAVFFVDILGFSFLTSKDNSKDISNLPNNVINKYLKEIKSNDNNIDFKLEDDYSKKLLISTWLLKNFRECINKVVIKYKISNDVFSDCAYLWSSSIKDLLFAVNDLMWNLTFKGILCRGGLSFGTIIENDGNNKNKIILGEAVSNAYKNENSTGGKGCRIFTDSLFVTEASEEINRLLEVKKNKNVFGNINYRFILEIYKDLFKSKRIYTTYSNIDEFQWYLYPYLQSLISNNSICNNKKVYQIKSILFLTELIVRIISSERYLWNRLNSNGKIQLSASCLAIIDSIKEVLEKYEYLFNFESDYVDKWHENRKLDDNLQKKLFKSFVDETLEFTDLNNKEKNDLCDLALNHFSVCLENNYFINNVWKL